MARKFPFLIFFFLAFCLFLNNTSFAHIKSSNIASWQTKKTPNTSILSHHQENISWKFELLKLAEEGKIKAVLFDLGHTLLLQNDDSIFTSSLKALKKNISQEFGIEIPDPILSSFYPLVAFPGIAPQKGNTYKPLWLGKGELEPDELIKDLNTYLQKHSLTNKKKMSVEEALRPILIHAWKPNTELRIFIDQLKQRGVSHFGILSDMMKLPDEIKQEMIRNLENWFPNTFQDSLVFSYEIGSLKQEARNNIFSDFKRLKQYFSFLREIPDIAPENIAFLDNSAAKSETAKKHGLQSYQYISLTNSRSNTRTIQILPIRLIADSDLESILQQIVYLSEEMTFQGLFRTAFTLREVRELLKNDPSNFNQVALDQAGSVVGFLFAEQRGEVAYLRKITVSPHMRGLKIGPQLLVSCLHKIKESGIENSYIKVMKTNIMIPTFRQWGFTFGEMEDFNEPIKHKEIAYLLTGKVDRLLYSLKKVLREQESIQVETLKAA